MGAINSSIPLMVQQPQVANPLDEYQKSLQIKSLIGQQQLQAQQQQENVQKLAQQKLATEQAQQDATDRDAFNKSFKDANGDWKTAIQNAPSNGVSATGLLRYQAARTDQVTKMATMDKELLANAQSKADLDAKDAYRVQQITDPDERASTWNTLRNARIKDGTHQANEIPAQVPDDETLSGIVNSNKATSDMAKEALALQEQKAKLPGEQAEATTKRYSALAQTMGGANEQLSWTARRNLAVQNDPQASSLIPEQYSPEAAQAVRQLGITPEQAAKAPVENAKMADWLKQNPTKLVNGQKVPTGPADFEKWEKSITPILTFGLSNQTGAGTGATPAQVSQKFGMTPEAFDQAAEKYNQTGVLPAVGRGPNGIALQRALMNRAGELHPGATLAANSAEYKANAASLTGLQKNLDAVSAFENTAGKNLDLFTNLAQKAIDSGIPILNTPLRMAAQGLGSADQLALNAARQTAVNEIAKVTSSPGLAGQLSDSARHEVEAFIPANATYGQALAVAKVLRQDMANRHQSYQDQVDDIQKRLGGKPQAQSPAFSAPSGAPPAPKEDGHKLKQNGQVVAVSKGGQWVAP
jgi:hypothetical protein